MRRLVDMGAAASVVGAASLRRARWCQTRCRLFDFELDAEVAQVRLRLDEARVRKHRHDLVNAFTAVEGAALIVGREPLSAADRSTLTDVLDSGMRRLRALLVAGEDDQMPLAELTSALAEEPAWRGRLRVDVAPGLVVAASAAEIAEVVRQLLTRAGRRAPSSPVTLRAYRNGQRIELWVDDRGRELTARERRQIRQPDRRRFFGPDPVGGLDVAIRLVREQGGEVRVDRRPGRGESFGISWPAPVG